MNGAISFAPAERSADGAGLSVAGTVAESYLLFWNKRRELFNSIILPSTFAGVILFATLQSYYTMLGDFLVAPSPKRAGVVFAILIAGALAWVFAASLLASAGASVAQGDHKPSGWWDVALGVAQARLFSAALRFVFIFFALACIAAALVVRSDELTAPGWVAAGIVAIAILAAIVLCVRAGFLLPALAQQERVAMVRRSFNLSGGNFWRLSMIWTALAAAPALVLFGLGELALGTWLSPHHLPTLHSAARAAGELARDYAGIPAALVLTLITTISLTLAGIGSQVAYRRLTELRY